MPEEEDRMTDDLEKGSTGAPTGDDSNAEAAVAAVSEPVDTSASASASATASETVEQEKIEKIEAPMEEQASEKQAIVALQGSFIVQVEDGAASLSPPASEDNATNTKTKIKTKLPKEVSVVEMETPFPNEYSEPKKQSSESWTQTPSATATASGAATATATVSENDKSYSARGTKTIFTTSIRGRASTPGAFFVPNPLGASAATDAATTTTTTTTTTTSYYHNTSNVLDERVEMEPPIHVQTERIAVAEEVAYPEQANSSGETGNKKDDYKRTVRCVLAAAIALVIVVVIVFLRVRGGRQESARSPTQQPQQVEGERDRDRRASIIDVLSPFVVSNPDAFDPDSPEASSDRIQALEWLVATDPMQIEPTSEENIHKLRQRFVSALLYHATNGEHWDEQFWYLSGFDECTWNSVRSTAQEDFWFPQSDFGFEAKGNLCNKDGWLMQLNIYWNNLAGTLPPEITYFKKSLKQLVLGGGALQGTIPESYGEFESLEAVSFLDNCLTGRIPEALITIPTLEILSMYSNPGLYGSLNSFCNHSVYRDGVVVVVGDNCNTNETDYGVDCDCCSCCDPDNYWCVDPIYGGFQTHFTDMTDDGYVKNFRKPCMSEEQKAWVDENCPCMIMVPGVGTNQCTTNCSAVDAIPVKTFWSDELE